MKKTILLFLRALSRLVTLNHRVFLLLKDEVVFHPSEHLIRSVALVKKNVKDRRNMLVLDIGAAGGDSVLFLSRQLPECRIVGFEPIPASFALAEKKTKGLARVELRNLALFHEKGEMDFHITRNSVSSSLKAPDLSHDAISATGLFQDATVQKVKVSTLDSEVPADAPVLLMKLDTQGSELDVLKGASDVLKRTRFVLTEMNNHDDYVDACKYHEVDAFLRSNGFILADIIVSYRNSGRVIEYDAIYINEAGLPNQAIRR